RPPQPGPEGQGGLSVNDRTSEERARMANATRMHKAGGPEVLVWKEVPLGKPGQGEVRLRHTAIGLNYIDPYHRSGLYPLPLPTTIGSEAAGIIEEVGPGVSEFKKGDRAAYGGRPLRSYC